MYEANGWICESPIVKEIHEVTKHLRKKYGVQRFVLRRTVWKKYQERERRGTEYSRMLFYSLQSIVLVQHIHIPLVSAIVDKK